MPICTARTVSLLLLPVDHESLRIKKNSLRFSISLFSILNICDFAVVCGMFGCWSAAAACAYSHTNTHTHIRVQLFLRLFVGFSPIVRQLLPFSYTESLATNGGECFVSVSKCFFCTTSIYCHIYWCFDRSHFAIFILCAKYWFSTSYQREFLCVYVYFVLLLLHNFPMQHQPVF